MIPSTRNTIGRVTNSGLSDAMTLSTNRSKARNRPRKKPLKAPRTGRPPFIGPPLIGRTAAGAGRLGRVADTRPAAAAAVPARPATPAAAVLAPEPSTSTVSSPSHWPSVPLW